MLDGPHFLGLCRTGPCSNFGEGTDHLSGQCSTHKGDGVEEAIAARGACVAAAVQRGIVGMARTNDPNSATSQFLIMHADVDFMERKYTVVRRSAFRDGGRG
jgi:cyclophilin family peptidyl-prolyl cis-trans isomerase